MSHSQNSSAYGILQCPFHFDISFGEKGHAFMTTLTHLQKKECSIVTILHDMNFPLVFFCLIPLMLMMAADVEDVMIQKLIRTTVSWNRGNVMFHVCFDRNLSLTHNFKVETTTTTTTWAPF
jgi:hypothetical protein